MTHSRLIRYHSAYFRGWAQAFGAHEVVTDDPRGLRWLFGEGQLGLILTPAIRDRLAGFLGDGDAERIHAGAGAEPPRSVALSLSDDALRIGTLTLPIAQDQGRVVACARDLLDSPADLHLYQTYHLIYASGTRILTLSQHAPLGLIYRELEPLRVSLATAAVAQR